MLQGPGGTREPPRRQFDLGLCTPPDGVSELASRPRMIHQCIYPEEPMAYLSGFHRLMLDGEIKCMHGWIFSANGSDLLLIDGKHGP